ncbi:PE-PPE domain-containing protein [Mycobacterium bourgelatii]|uniref:PE family protein PE1 n=1 Tax=Mycobacterium bourgelatii TaxID=1273442 RepID=A0A7I9YZR9_MYCBU|nr:PE-PPE domain-containing protein [Mycobacterium bourgelatii]MCV6976578.1 PE-PPE domain-containing protein [Mycobacterium bourgelatii]GFG94027.1 PE family protein PE1 [Mycobacterium bourgelatii]
MSFLATQPQLMTLAAENLAGIQTAIAEASATAAGPTTGLVAAAADEVSAAISNLFGAFGQEYQGLVQQAEAYHSAFVQALTAGANAYTQAEAASQQLLAGASGAAAPAQTALLGDTFAWIIGGSGTPIPSATYVDQVLRYVREAFTVNPGNFLPLFTPEGLQPIYTGIKSLPLNTSVSQGIQILDFNIKNTLANPPVGVQSVAVLGYSQSAIIASLEMRNLMNPLLNPTPPAPDQLGFTLLGNPMNPNGGLLARFPGLSLPSLGLDFYGATPPDTPYPTNIYTLQYDGFASFPRYPLNFLSDLNAFLGIQTIHGKYPSLDINNLPPGYDVVTLPGSESLTGVGETNYYMITHPDLPIMAPIKAIPIIGGPLNSLLEPNMRILVNLGYGDPNFGYPTGPANEPTPFGLFPDVDYVQVAGMLANGTQQGFTNMMADITGMTPSAESLPATLTSFLGSGSTAATSVLSAAPTSATDVIRSIQSANTNITNAFTNATSNAYALFLPTLDIGNALVTTMPSYDINLFLDGVAQMMEGDIAGGLAYALVAPVAADTAIVTLAAGFQFIVILNTIEAILGIG